MERLLIEVPEENVELLLALLPKFNARLISRDDKMPDQPIRVSIFDNFVQFDGQYFYDTFEVSQLQHEELKSKYPNAIYKNNRDVGRMAIEIVASYLTHKFPSAEVRAGSNGADLEFMFEDKVELL